MGAMRKDRARKETTFLEHVEFLLQQLCSELAEVKETVQRLSCHDDVLLPPPAPPPMDVYNRDFLLEARQFMIKEHTCTTATEEYDDITEFLIKSGNWDLKSMGHEFESTCKAMVEDPDTADIERQIRAAQRTACENRQRENKAISRIQKFWKSCKCKLGWTSNQKGQSNAPDGLVSYFATLRASMEAPGFNVAFSQWLEDEDVDGGRRPLAGGGRAEHLDQFPMEIRDMLDHILEMGANFDADARAAFTFKAFRGMVLRKGLARNVYFRNLPKLEAILGVKESQVPNFIPGAECMTCHRNYDRCSCDEFKTTSHFPMQNVLEHAPPDLDTVFKFALREEDADFICKVCAALYDDMYFFCRLCGSHQIVEWHAERDYDLTSEDSRSSTYSHRQ